jgi:hypothetical protein
MRRGTATLSPSPVRHGPRQASELNSQATTYYLAVMPGVDHVSPEEGIDVESGGWPVHTPYLIQRAPNLRGQTLHLRLLFKSR